MTMTIAIVLESVNKINYKFDSPIHVLLKDERSRVETYIQFFDDSLQVFWIAS